MAVSTKKQKLLGDLDKNKRYDRQLRLWGDHGQYALESSHVCLINATATGTEILKSLVLPGIGAFTIVDGHKITDEDAGNNFFLDKDRIGESRARVATSYLLELNSEVQGDFVEEHIDQMLGSSPTFFQKFSIVVATSLTEKTLLLLADKLWKEKIPLLVCRSYGMIGYMRLQIVEHCVVESHPESDFYDLRLDKPFPLLQQFVDSIDMDNLNNKDHSHIPFVVILLKYLNQWKQSNDGRLPKTVKEKNLFKSEIKNGMREQKDGEEENFEEAVKAVNRSIVETNVPSNVKELLIDHACTDLSYQSEPFWIMMKALKKYCDEHGYLPLSGVIPDMTADTERYITLQRIYRTKAEEDASVLFQTAQSILSSLGKPCDLITENDVKLFCKNARYLRVVRGTPITEEYVTDCSRISDLMQNLDHEDDCDIVYYALLRAVDKFHSEFSRYPGLHSNQVEPDVAKLKNCMNNLLQDWGSVSLSKDDYVHEMCRYGAAELHSVAAFIGGCAAQEIIKVITRQYVPFNNTFIYNAISSTTSVFYL